MASPPNYNSMVLAALILACIGVFFSAAADAFLLYEYSLYVDTKDTVKKLYKAHFDVAIFKTLVTALTTRAQENEMQFQNLEARLAALEGRKEA